jgi:transposase
MESGRRGISGHKRMMYLGIDIASETYTATLLTTPTDYRYLGEYPNTLQGFRALLKRLPPDTEIIIIMEATGVYTEHFCHFFYTKRLPLCVEPPHKVKRAFYEREKTDPIDSRLLAEYGFRFPDRLHPWKPKSEIIEELHALCTIKEQYTQTMTALKNAKTALKRKHRPQTTAIALHETMIAQFKQAGKTIEQEIPLIIKQDPGLYRHFQHLQTIPGVGIWIATYFLILTEGCTKYLNGKQLASYLGICPMRKESGKMKKRPKKDNAGPGYIAGLFFLASMTSAKNNPMLKAYYHRLLQQGKDKPLALNNVANKLLHLMCAIVLSNKPYRAHYTPLPPTF